MVLEVVMGKISGFLTSTLFKNTALFMFVCLIGVSYALVKTQKHQGGLEKQLEAKSKEVARLSQLIVKYQEAIERSNNNFTTQITNLNRRYSESKDQLEKQIEVLTTTSEENQVQISLLEDVALKRMRKVKQYEKMLFESNHQCLGYVPDSKLQPFAAGESRGDRI